MSLQGDFGLVMLALASVVVAIASASPAAAGSWRDALIASPAVRSWIESGQEQEVQGQQIEEGLVLSTL